MKELTTTLATIVAILLFSSVGFAQTVSTLTDSLSASGDIAVDAAGNIYVADFGATLGNANGTRVYKVTPTGSISVFATGLSGASGNEFDDAGNLYQSNIAIGVVSKILPDGTVTTFSTGHAGPVGIALDDDENVYVANCGDATIRKVTPAGVMSTLASGGFLSCPNGLTFAPDGNLYTCNFNDGRVIRVELDGTQTVINTVPGNNNGHLTYSQGALWLVGRGGNRVFRLTLTGQRIRVAGFAFRGNTDGDRTMATFSLPNGIGVSPDGSRLYVNSVVALAGTGLNPVVIREIDVGVATGVEGAFHPEPLGLRNFPNPARPSTRIEYQLARTGAVALDIYDVTGRRVRRLVEGSQDAGPQSVSWNGTDQLGRPVAAGVYLYELRTADHQARERMLILR